MKARLMISLLVFMSLLLGAGGQSNLFVCFGADGHVAVESSACESDPCGPCIDVPLFSSALTEPRTALNAKVELQPSGLTAASVLPLTAISQSLHKPAPGSADFADPLPALRRTVVLVV